MDLRGGENRPPPSLPDLLPLARTHTQIHTHTHNLSLRPQLLHLCILSFGLRRISSQEELVCRSSSALEMQAQTLGHGQHRVRGQTQGQGQGDLDQKQEAV